MPGITIRGRNHAYPSGHHGAVKSHAFLRRPSPRAARIMAARLYAWLRQRGLGLLLALVIEALLVLLLLTLGRSPPLRNEEAIDVVRVTARSVTEDSQPPQHSASRASPRVESSETPPIEPKKTTPRLAKPDRRAAPIPFVLLLPKAEMAAADIGTMKPPSAAAAPAGPKMGPPDTGTPGDTPRVGTAPNGEALYAAAWYREPYESELRGYLSTATGPGWGLIACRTASDFRVEDCLALDEHPSGSSITRSALAAAWQFRVRPPRRGGQVLVGAWVRIRINYDLKAS